MFCLVPVFWLLVIGVGDGSALIPVLRLLGFRILNLLWCKEVPVILQRSRLNLLVINQHLVCVIGLNDQRVEMCELVVFAADFFVDEVVLSFVTEDDVNL